MKQKAFQSEPGQFPLRGLVARRLFGKFPDTEQQAVGKQIFTEADGISFSMHKVKPLPSRAPSILESDEANSASCRQSLQPFMVSQAVTFCTEKALSRNCLITKDLSTESLRLQ